MSNEKPEKAGYKYVNAKRPTRARKSNPKNRRYQEMKRLIVMLMVRMPAQVRSRTGTVLAVVAVAGAVVASVLVAG